MNTETHLERAAREFREAMRTNRNVPAATRAYRRVLDSRIAALESMWATRVHNQSAEDRATVKLIDRH